MGLGSLVPRPLQILSDKIWEWPGDGARAWARLIRSADWCARRGLGMSSSDEGSGSEEELAKLREAVSGVQVQSAKKDRRKQRNK